MLSKHELETVAKVIDDLDHYRILKVDPMASESEIRDAFHREALAFHPDQYFSEEDPELSTLAKKVYSRVVLAYRELLNPDTRLTYDKKMKIGSPSTTSQSDAPETGEKNEFQSDAITSIKRRPSWAQKAPGEKFFQLAERAYASRDIKSALMNVQIALSAEPDNSQYQRFKSLLEAELEKKKS